MRVSGLLSGVHERIRTSDLPLRSSHGTMLRSDGNCQEIRSSAGFFTSRKSISYHPVMADISMFFTVPFASLLAGHWKKFDGRFSVLYHRMMGIILRWYVVLHGLQRTGSRTASLFIRDAVHVFWSRYSVTISREHSIVTPSFHFPALQISSTGWNFSMRSYPLRITISSENQTGFSKANSWSPKSMMIPLVTHTS